MVRERQGEKVGENCMVEEYLQSDTQARLQSGGKKGFGGRIMNHHMQSKKRRIGTAHSTVEAGTGG